MQAMYLDIGRIGSIMPVLQKMTVMHQRATAGKTGLSVCPIVIVRKNLLRRAG
jgi:hypothetical protein